MTAKSSGHVLVECLADLGVRHFFGVPGESFLEVLDAAETDPRTQLVSTRHESGASFMAEASAKMTGVPAVAMATRAVGAANLAIGVHTALHDSTPLVALVGQVSQEHRGREGFQEIDLQSFYRPITKWTASLQHPSRARELAYRAFTAATSGRPGPVLIELPADVLAQATGAGWPGGHRPHVETARAVPDTALLREVATRVAAASRPVVIAGLGARSARSELIRFAATYDLGVYSAFRRQDVFPNDDPRYLGHLTLGTSANVLRALREADLVLVLGSRLSEVTSQGFTLPSGTSEVIQIDVEAESFGPALVPRLALVADVRATLDGLLQLPAPERTGRDWVESHAAYWAESTMPAANNTAAISPGEVVDAMSRALPADTVVASDAGNFSIFLHRYWRYCLPCTQVAPTSGAMGYGLPAAIGAKLASPGRTVVAVAGDGGFLMTGQELETAVRHELPVVVIVLRNGMYGTIAMHQLRTFGRTAGTDIGEVDLVRYAEGLGAAAFGVRDRSDLMPALTAALGAGRPALVDVAVDPEAITPTARLAALAAK